MTSVIGLLRERAERPGLIGLVGMAAERRCYRDMRGYFKKLHDEVIALKLEEIVRSGVTVEVATHSAEMRVHNVLRNLRSLLLGILSTNIFHTVRMADKADIMAEAEKKIKVDLTASQLDKLGLTGERAAEYAAKYAAQLVTDIDRTTQKIIADAIKKAILEQVGIPNAARMIKATLENMTTSRALMIARTETNAAWSWSALEKMHREGVQYKQLIAHPDELLCPACSSIADAGPVPVDEPFVDDEGEEYDSSPIHPNCRCATTGAPPPEDT
jgi:hypothetical protein